jgi:C-terminal processing protease CtpA/Prc
MQNRGVLGIGTAPAGEDGLGLQIARLGRGGPADLAGLLEGDVVLTLDGADVTGLPLEQISLRGQAGETLHLTVRRAGVPEPLEFAVVRAPASR